MKDHLWKLIKTPWYSRDESCTTVFPWRCAGCGTEVNTATSRADVGTHAAEHFSPKPHRLKKVGILLDCNDEAVRLVLEQ